jgi:hypothetical protein
MPTIALCIAMILMCVCSTAQGQNCVLSGTKAWNSELRNIVADCPDKFSSPNGRFVLRIGNDGALSLWTKPGQKQFQWDAPKLEPPAMISWSPESNAFFLNDGDGSGMSSAFRLFRLNENRVEEDTSIERAAVSLYRGKAHCSPSAADPNVWGFGWGDHGGQILLLVQPTVNEPCGTPEDFISLIVREHDGTILKTLSKAQTKARFGSVLPSTIFLK